MGDRSAIEWTEATWNPIRARIGTWSCVKISEGCQHCYAERLNVRVGGPRYVVGADTLRLDERVLAQPLHWTRPRRIFVCSMTDLFEDRVPAEWIERVFLAMLKAPQHTYQILTKRAERMAHWVDEFCASACWPESGCPVQEVEDGLPGHIWAGVSAENQERLNERAFWLLRTPAEVRFLSVEPLLGPVDLSRWPKGLYLRTVGRDGAADRAGVNWVIVGGESGGPPDRALVFHDGETDVPSPSPHRGRWVEKRRWSPKPEALAWVRAVRDQCVAAGVPWFFKQWGGPTPKAGGRVLDGRTWDEYPA